MLSRWRGSRYPLATEFLSWLKKRERQLEHPLISQVADLIGADSKEIIFTSGATESNNMAIKGVAGFYKVRDGIESRHLEWRRTAGQMASQSCL